MGLFLQRLFSTFPDGLPGAGLLCLRLGAGISLIHFAIANPSAGPIIAASAGLLLLAGLWTPVGGTLIAVTELWMAFSQRGDLWIDIVLAALAAGLALLGPGAWSVDARLFGRKRFSIPPKSRITTHDYRAD